MPDRSWRAWERRWRAQPGDRAAQEALAAARRRTGAGLGLADAEGAFPSRRFASEFPLKVHVELPNGRAFQVGRTPREDGIKLPRHRHWWAQPERPASFTKERLAELVGEVVAQGITGLDLKGCPLDNFELRPLEQAAPLRWLSLEGLAITGPALGHLAGLEQLHTLDLSHCGRVLGGLRHLVNAPLERLNVTGCELTPSGLQAIRELEHLSTVQLEGAPVKAEILQLLAELPRLEELALPRSRFQGGVLDRLYAAPRLQSLSLAWGGITDEQLEQIAQLPHLEELDLSFCHKITAAGLRGLAPLAGRLRSLSLYGNEKLKNEVVLPLSQLEGLTHLDLSHTKLTKTRVAALAKLYGEDAVVSTIEPTVIKRANPARRRP